MANTPKKMKFPTKDFFSKYDQIRSFLQDFVPFTEEILNEKLHFLFSGKADTYEGRWQHD